MIAKLDVLTAMRAQLLGVAAIAELVGTGIFPLRAPIGEPLPRLIFREFAYSRVGSLDGDSGAADLTVELVAQAETLAEALALVSECETALYWFRGNLGGPAGPFIQQTLIVGLPNGYTPPVDDSGNGVCETITRVRFLY